MPFGFDWNNDDDARVDEPGFGSEPTPAAQPAPVMEPAAEPTPMPEPEASPEPIGEHEADAVPESEPAADAGKPASAGRASVRGKTVRMNERLADMILSTRRMLDDPTVRAAMCELTGKDSDEELTAMMLRIRHGVNGRMPERRQVRDLLEAVERLRDERLRDVLVRASGRDGEARLALMLMDGHVDGAQLLVAAHDEQNPVARVTMLLSQGMRDAQRLRAAARLLVALDPALAERVRPQGGSQMDLAAAIADTIGGVDVDPVRGLA